MAQRRLGVPCHRPSHPHQTKKPDTGITSHHRIMAAPALHARKFPQEYIYIPRTTHAIYNTAAPYIPISTFATRTCTAVPARMLSQTNADRREIATLRSNHRRAVLPHNTPHHLSPFYTSNTPTTQTHYRYHTGTRVSLYHSPALSAAGIKPLTLRPRALPATIVPPAACATRTPPFSAARATTTSAAAAAAAVPAGPAVGPSVVTLPCRGRRGLGLASLRGLAR